MRLETRTATLYYAPTRRKKYQTLTAAAKAEARAQLDRKYPREHGDDQDAGWHWSNEAAHMLTYARLSRWLMRRFFHPEATP